MGFFKTLANIGRAYADPKSVEQIYLHKFSDTLWEGMLTPPVAGNSWTPNDYKLHNYALNLSQAERETLIKPLWDDVKQTILAINGRRLTDQSRHEQQIILLECAGKLHELLCKRAGILMEGS
jgi:hypothetical protein